MKQIILLFGLLSITFISCNKSGKFGENKELSGLCDQYYEERLSFFPFEATSQGDNRFNDKLPNDLTDKFRNDLFNFYQNYSEKLSKIKIEDLNEEEKIVYENLKYSIETELEGLNFPTNLIPFHQFWGLPLTMGQMGSGDGSQPFKTTKDYYDWLKRIDGFVSWSDTAISCFNKGIKQNIVLPKSLVIKMIPQMNNMVVANPTESLFYGPISKLPKEFSEAEKLSITKLYTEAISNKIIPTYKKLGTYLQNEYLPNARSSSGLSTIPTGDAYYNYLIKYWTTTDKTADDVFQIGMAEVNRIKAEMEKVKTEVKFKGTLTEFFDYLKNDKKFMPYKTPEEVLAAFRNIQKTIDPNLKTMFNNTPKSKFEIRRTEAFREASASAEYNVGSADGSRPGIFYVPIPDASMFNTTSGMESLFLHEAIPGHHYQSSLQQENTNLPKFMRFNWYGAYGEGWALYCESLGKDLGLYKDPFQYMGALGDEMHRAIRLVVDVGIHAKNWTREDAIGYMLANEAISTDGAVAEIERYMAIPGQALSYKIGAIKIRELRNKYQNNLKANFKLADFHDEFLKHGCMPLDVLESKMDAWSEKIINK
jgi:uncharacterized protein (DUF885 family)